MGCYILDELELLQVGGLTKWVVYILDELTATRENDESSPSLVQHFCGN